jgi:uncharacterized protein (TIGR03382 family)
VNGLKHQKEKRSMDHLVGGPYSISAIVEGNLIGSNYLITTIDSGSITIGTGVSAITYTDTGLLPASSSQTLLYAWDSLISTGGNAPFSLTTGGLLFTSNSAPINGSPPLAPTEFNLYIDGPPAVSSDNSNNVNSEFHGDLTISMSGSAGETPIPAALPLFATGLGLLGWRRRRKNAAELAA